MLKEIVRRNRSYRRFDEKHQIRDQVLVELVDLARLSPSGANLQPLKYMLSADVETNAKIFPALKWAGYFQDWDGPEAGERPTAYIVMLGDTQVSKNVGCDHGISAQTILLGAAELGLGGCMIGNLDRNLLREELNISESLDILLVLALGRSIEEVEVDTIGADGSVKYWRDDNRIHHVPKRSLEEIIIR